MLTALMLLSLAARADVPSVFPETCTLERMQSSTNTCVECRTWHGAGGEGEADQTCDAQYADTEFARVCKTDGASAWTEVWCDGPARQSGCLGCSTVASAVGGSFLLGLAGALGRRRRGVGGNRRSSQLARSRCPSRVSGV